MLVHPAHEQFHLFGGQNVVAHEIVSDPFLLRALIVEKRFNLEVRQQSEPDGLFSEAARDVARRDDPLE